MDFVGTCPKTFWKEWLAEGDCAGDEHSGWAHHWITRSRLALKAKPGDRFYIVAHGRLRGYATVLVVRDHSTCSAEHTFSIVRGGGAVACTIDKPIPGFRGLRKRWWKREDEYPFENWRKP